MFVLILLTVLFFLLGCLAHQIKNAPLMADDFDKDRYVEYDRKHNNYD